MSQLETKYCTSQKCSGNGFRKIPKLVMPKVLVCPDCGHAITSKFRHELVRKTKDKKENPKFI